MGDEEAEVQEAIKIALAAAIENAVAENGDLLFGAAIVTQGHDLALLIPGSRPYLITITSARFQVQGG